jgi:S1-C subfamily serine protease
MESWSGSGAILKSGQILTNAHVVANAVSIDVKLEGASERYPAEVAFINHASDLALLTVKDPAFYEGSRQLELGAMPQVQDAVEVFGYPEGGDSMSITTGVVSRIEIGSYAHSMARLLLVQIDAAINAGNSGGPVIANGRVVGIATQRLEDSQNIGYVVPLPVIRQFLKDTEDGRVDGPQRLGLVAQDLESPALRARYGLTAKESGAIVIKVNHGAPAWDVIEPGDVMLAIDGHPIANDLSVGSDYGTRLSWASVLMTKQAGDTLNVQLIRDGKRMEKSVRLHPWQRLVPRPNMSDVGRYRVFGGFVFQPLTADYLRIDPENYDSGMMNIFQYHNLRTPEQSEILILSHVLPDEASRGYFGWYDEIVARVQGQTPRDLTHLNEIIDSATGQWLEIEMLSGYRFVLDLEQSRRTSAELLARFSIGADRSPLHGAPASSE